MNQGQILNSGDLELIVTLDEETILEHFGEESFEYLAYEHMLAEQMERQKLRIPRRTENPAVTKGMLKNWIQEFLERNNKLLPKGYHHKNKRQLQGMYRGMLDHYNIRLTDIVPHHI